MNKRCLFPFFILGIFMIKMNAQQQELKLWPDGVPGSKTDANYKESMTDERGRQYRTVKVSDPTIKVFLPKKENANGAAVLICPGGAYHCLAYDIEGFKVAEWLNKNGIAGILLKYRLPSDVIMQDKSIGPLQDAQQAMRMIRMNAKKWNIDPDKIGVIGFSAGGHLASTLSTQFGRKVYKTDAKISARPDFSVLLYPVISMDTAITHMGSRENLIGKSPSDKLVHQFSNELQITEQTPISFLVHSANDRSVPVENSINYFLSLKANKVDAELHIFEKGGHGYGLDKYQGTQLQWPKLFLGWLKQHKII